MQYKKRNPNRQEEELKLKAANEAQNSRAHLLVKQPFVGMLAMRMEIIPVVDFRLPTASTNGEAIFVNAEYLMGLDTKHRIYLLAHEIWHCVFLHFKRKGDRDRKKFNYAADLEIDFMLQEQGIEPDYILPHKKEWRGLSAEAIYDLLDEEAKRHENSDVHIYAGDDDGLPGTQNTDNIKTQEGQEGEKSQEETDSGNEPASQTIVIDSDYTPTIMPNTGRRWRQRVISVAQQIERTKGTLPAYLKEMIQAHYKPELNWKEILQQFVSYCFGGERRWLPPNRRYIGMGQYLPGRKDPYLSVVVAVDTSSSTIGDLPFFLAELKGIVRSFGRYDVTLIECDMEIQNVRSFDEGDPFEFEQIEFSGFGGTDFSPVFKYIYKYVQDPKLLIYLTDGYGNAPDNPPEYPVLWVLTSDGQPPAHWGWKTFLK